MRDYMGISFGSVLNALDPRTHLRIVAQNPFNPLKQTQALLNVARGGRPASPTQAAAQQAPWGGMPPGYGAPPGYPPPGYADPNMYAPQYGPPPVPPGYMPPGYGYAPMGPTQGAYQFDASMYAPPPDWGNAPTGWDAAYGGSAGAGW